MHLPDYLIIALYMAIVIGIGVYFSRNENSSEEYLLGGRKMPFLAIGLSCMMSLLSSISIVIVPGEIYKHGLTLFVLSATLGTALGIPCFLLFTRFYFKLGSFTPYEYLEYRYSPGVRSVIAISSLYIRILYLGSVLFTTSKVFQGAYGWEPWITILLVGIIGMIYTVMGGMKAVVWSDVVQFVVLAVGFTVVVIVLCNKINGGAFYAISYAVEHGRGAPQFWSPEFYKFNPYMRLNFWILLSGAVIAPLTNACSDQISIQRLLSTKNWKDGFRSQVTSVLSAWPFIAVLWFVGLALFTFYSQHPDSGVKDADGIFFHFIANNLPTPFPGIFMAAMLAAIMSTLDSGMNSMATIYLKEVHQKYINKKMPATAEVKISRYATFGVGMIAISLGLLLDSSGKWLAQSAAEVGTLFGMIATIILPAFLFAVLSPRANSMLIWLLTFFAIGDNIAMNLWYALSRVSTQSWQPGGAMGWGGPINFYCALIPFIAGIVFILPWCLCKERRRSKWILSLTFAGAFSFGLAQAMLLWVFFSNTMITTEPLARSFAFGLPSVLIFGFIALNFFPKQAKEKYQGLTLGTINEPLIKS